jgi:dihydroneopterin aldolase
MSDRISLRGIKGFGYHGVFEHEAKNGQDFFFPKRAEPMN